MSCQINHYLCVADSNVTPTITRHGKDNKKNNRPAHTKVFLKTINYSALYFILFFTPTLVFESFHSFLKTHFTVKPK